MSRLFTVATVLLAVASAFVLYATSYETRQLELHVAAQARTIEKTSLDIAILRAERAYFARPERIDELARMLAGVDDSSAAQQHARELLELAHAR